MEQIRPNKTNQLKEAEENVERIKATYKDEPALLAFYLPSAEYLVAILTPFDDGGCAK